MNTIQKTVVVTGAGSGIGLAIAEIFVREGFNVVLNGRTKEKLVCATKQISHPDQVAIVAGDITNPKSSDQIVKITVERFGKIDILINNAGIFNSKAFTEYTIDELDTYLGYLRGTFVLTQAAVRQMQKQGHGGAIINIGTVLASNSIFNFPSSAPVASKGGIMALTKNLSVELALDNIRINAVAPGVVYTPILGKLSKEQLSSLDNMQPLGRHGNPQDIADAVFYLANASWTTGVILPVDGGVDASGDGRYHGIH